MRNKDVWNNLEKNIKQSADAADIDRVPCRTIEKNVVQLLIFYLSVVFRMLWICRSECIITIIWMLVCKRYWFCTCSLDSHIGILSWCRVSLGDARWFIDQRLEGCDKTFAGVACKWLWKSNYFHATKFFCLSYIVNICLSLTF